MNTTGWKRLAFTLTLSMTLLTLFLSLPWEGQVVLGSSAASPSGGPLGVSFLINGESGDQVHSAVAYNSQDEEYLVVWHNEWPGNKDVYGQRVSKDGLLLGPRRVVSPVGGERYDPDVTYNSRHNEYLVVWEDNLNVQGQRVSAAGLTTGDMFTITNGVVGLSYYTEPAVDYAYTADRYLVVFRYGHLVGGRSIEARALESNGSLVGSGPFEVEPFTTTTGLPEQPDLAYNRARNEFLVAWQEWIVHPGANSYDIHGRRVRMAGPADPGPLGLEFTVSENQYVNLKSPAVAAIPRPAGVGQYLVVHHADVTDQGWIGGQRLTGEAALQGTGFTIPESCFPNCDLSSPAVAGNESGEQYLAVWTHKVLSPVIYYYIDGRTVSTGGSLGRESEMGGLLADQAAVASGWLGDFLVTCDDQPGTAERNVYGYRWGNRLYLPLVLRECKGTRGQGEKEMGVGSKE